MGNLVKAEDAGTLKKWRVHGYALVPVEVEMEVAACTEKGALAIAQHRFKMNKNQYVYGSSVDGGAAYDWEPTAEVIL
jgi:hypothetical protein